MPLCSHHIASTVGFTFLCISFSACSLLVETCICVSASFLMLNNINLLLILLFGIPSFHPVRRNLTLLQAKSCHRWPSSPWLLAPLSHHDDSDKETLTSIIDIFTDGNCFYGRGRKPQPSLREKLKRDKLKLEKAELPGKQCPSISTIVFYLD